MHYAKNLLTTSFAVSLYGQCCRCHVVGQQVIGDVSIVIVVEVFVACVLNLIILICYYACSLLYLERLFNFTYQTYFVYNMALCAS